MNSVMVGQPIFNFDLDTVNPIGSVSLAINYLFYDLRLNKLSKFATFEFIQKTLIKLAEKAYFMFKKPLKYYLSYLKCQHEDI